MKKRKVENEKSIIFRRRLLKQYKMWKKKGWNEQKKEKQGT